MCKTNSDNVFCACKSQNRQTWRGSLLLVLSLVKLHLVPHHWQKQDKEKKILALMLQTVHIQNNLLFRVFQELQMYGELLMAFTYKWLQKTHSKPQKTTVSSSTAPTASPHPAQTSSAVTRRMLSPVGSLVLPVLAVIRYWDLVREAGLRRDFFSLFGLVVPFCPWWGHPTQTGPSGLDVCHLMTQDALRNKKKWFNIFKQD